LQTEQQRLADIKKSIKHMRSVNIYIDLKEQKSRHYEFSEKLRILRLEENEIQQEYQETLFQLAGLIEKEVGRLKALMEEYSGKLKDIAQKLEDRKNQIRVISSEKQDVSNRLAICNSNKIRLEKEYRQHAARFDIRDMTLLLDLEMSLENFEKSLDELKKTVQTLSERLRQLSIQLEDSKTRQNNLNMEKKTLEERLSTKKQTESTYNKKLRTLEEQVKALGIDTGIYSATIGEKLQALADKTASDLANAQVDYNAVENRKLLLDGLDYYIPDKDILKVNTYLQENGVISMPGSFWLKNQPADKKEELLKRNPLLPYSIIIDSTQLERAAALSESAAKLAEDYPVAVIVASSEGLDYTAENENAGSVRMQGYEKGSTEPGNMQGREKGSTEPGQMQESERDSAEQGLMPVSKRGSTEPDRMPESERSSAGPDYRLLDPLRGTQVFILRSENSRLLVDEQELEEYIKSLGQRLEKSHNYINTLKADHNKIISIREKVLNFVEEYNQEWKNTLARDIDDLTKRIGFLNTEAAKLDDIQGKLKESIDETDKMCRKTETEIKETELDIVEMKELIRIRNAIAECDSSIKILSPLLKELSGKEQALQNERENLFAVQKEIEDKYKEVEREARKLNERLKEIRRELPKDRFQKTDRNDIQTDRDDTQTDQSGINARERIDKLEAIIHAHKVKLSSNAGDTIMDSIRIIEGVIARCQSEIRNNGYSEQDFEDVYERIPDSEIQKAEETEKGITGVIAGLEKDYRSVETEINKLAGVINTLVKTLERNYGIMPYEFRDGEPLEPEYYEERRKVLKSRRTKLESRLKEITEHKNSVEKQSGLIRQFIEDRGIEMPGSARDDMLKLKGFEEEIGLWDFMKMQSVEMAVLFKRYREAYDELEKKAKDGCKSVEECFESLYTNSEWMDNAVIKSILSGIMSENLFNVRYMKELFEKLFQSVRRMRDAETLQLEECMRNKGELMERCLQRAKTVYEEVKLVDTFSKIKVSGENRKIVRIDLPKFDEEQGRSYMTIYLEKCIEEIGRMKEQDNYDPAKIDNTINGYMAPQALLDAVIGLNNISIKVFKPEHNLEFSQYIPWEVVIQWSGGEKLAGFFAMFISIISFLRYKRTGWQSSKVIWVDNPFGQANAGHLLGYIFELAKATNTQMICLTGLQETTIYAQFDVVYSLVHRMLSSMSIIQTKQVKAGQTIEVGYYNLKDEQMSFL
jgi:chromosome segregation ATPase